MTMQLLTIDIFHYYILMLLISTMGSFLIQNVEYTRNKHSVPHRLLFFESYTCAICISFTRVIYYLDIDWLLRRRSDFHKCSK